MKKQWRLLEADPKTVYRLARQLGCSPLLATLLVLRGFTGQDDASDFLSPSLTALTSPLEMAGMPTAIRRIHRAIVKKEAILVCGDYDTDGVTATALLVSFLGRCGAQVRYFIPYRMTDGYGLNADFIHQRARTESVDLIITVDCGSASGEAVDVAKQYGIDTIVTDHHPVDAFPSAAVAVVNPTRSDCFADLAHLAGVGVAFYLLIALRAHLREKQFWAGKREPNLIHDCDLVALGTVADLAPMVRENRVLTAAGLKQINRKDRPGIAALVNTAKTAHAPVDTEAIAFQLAPRLNAAGRLVHARIACELLLAQTEEKAQRLARALYRLNGKRRSLEKELFRRIVADLRENPVKLEQPALVVHGDRWHEGILGIIAARLVRKFNRPAVVISTRNGTGTGSGRSVEGIDLAAALQPCADLLTRWGGHPLAVGLSLDASRIEAFEKRLTAVVRQTIGQRRHHHPTLAIDARVSIADISPSLMTELERMAPFGQANPYPVFVDEEVIVESCRFLGDRHRKFVLSTRHAEKHKQLGIQFNALGDPPQAGSLVAVAYRPQWNHWNGKRQLQLLLEEVVPATACLLTCADRQKK